MTNLSSYGTLVALVGCILVVVVQVGMDKLPRDDGRWTAPSRTLEALLLPSADENGRVGIVGQYCGGCVIL